MPQLFQVTCRNGTRGIGSDQLQKHGPSLTKSGKRHCIAVLFADVP